MRREKTIKAILIPFSLFSLSISLFSSNRGFLHGSFCSRYAHRQHLAEFAASSMAGYLCNAPYVDTDCRENSASTGSQPESLVALYPLCNAPWTDNCFHSLPNPKFSD